MTNSVRLFSHCPLRPGVAGLSILILCGFARSLFGVPVSVESRGENRVLLRAGTVYRVRGAGGDGSKELLSACGANSIRTWGVGAGTGALLDEAESLGLTVTVGIWLGHARHGFDYGDAAAVARQRESALAAIRTYMGHPAVLAWGIGNEMEGNDGADRRIWDAIQDIAAAAKELDPSHPTLTVIAEVGGEKVRNLHAACPDIDIVGINTYAGAASLPRRYRDAGGTKPYIVTEFGPPGPWELPPGDAGVPEEPTGAAKADWYGRAYRAFEDDSGLCLGSYAFTWGNKQEATATWFGMLLADGSRTPVVDAMTELWSGKEPANRCPLILELVPDRRSDLSPGDLVRVRLDGRDPDGDAYTVSWSLRDDSGRYVTGGDAQEKTADLPDGIVEADAQGAVVRMPASGGVYRLFAIARDGHGGACPANVALRVKGPRVTKPPVAGRSVELPFAVYAEGGETDFAPSGWMGDAGAVSMAADCPDGPFSGKACLRVAYGKADGWAGVVWQDPPDDWGDLAGGVSVVGAARLVIRARGAVGGEKVKFGMGIIDRDKLHYDTTKGEISVTLSDRWQEFEIPLVNRDLSRIKTPFYWVVAGQGKPVTFYLDDVRYE